VRSVVKEPGKPPEVRDIGNANELQPLQELVGGYIEVVPFPVKNTVLVCNEEGKLMGLPPNFRAPGDVFVGTVVVLGRRGQNMRELTEKETDQVVSLLQSFQSW
jgi:hypothetical protein